MRRYFVWLPVVLLLAMIFWWVRSDSSSSSVRKESAGSRAVDEGAESGSTAEGKADDRPVEIVLDPDVRQAFRFQINAGKVTLEMVEDLHGKFKTRRGDPDWWPGMFYYRLLDSRNRVLAEETQPAPDHQCVVVDPNVKGPDGKPKAVSMTAAGPVVFQVRMPKDPRAAFLKVYRLTGPRKVSPHEEPVGELLASIAVPK